MGRSLNAAVLAEIDKIQNTPVHLARLDFPGGAIRRWTGVGNVTHENETYTGAGDLIGVGPIEETTELRATGAAFTLTGISSSFVGTVLTQDYQGREAKLWIGFLDSTGSLIASPVLIFSGLIDTCEISEAGDTATIVVRAENRLISMERSRQRRYTHEDQQYEYPNDKGFEYVSYMQDKKTFPDQVTVVRRHTTISPFEGTKTTTSLHVLDGPRPLTIQSPSSPRRLIYGRIRRGGTVVFAHFVSATSLQLVIALCEGPIQEIENGIYFDDLKLTLDVNGVPFTNSISSTSISASDTDNSFNTTGSFFFLYAPGALVKVSGFDNDVNNGLFRVKSMTATKLSVDGVFLMNEPAGTPSKTIEDPTYLRDYVVVRKHVGEPDQSADSRLTGLTSKWSNDHRLRGVAYIHVGITLDERVLPGGVPNITAIIKGRKVYDPRDGTTSYSTNAALCLRDYIQDLEFGLGELDFLDFGFVPKGVDTGKDYEDLPSTMTSSRDYGSVGESAALIDDASVSVAADLCDEDVPLAGGGSEKRYTVSGAIDLSQPRRAIIRQFTDAMDGQLFFAGGKWHMKAGTYVAPSFTLAEKDLRAPIQLVAKRPRSGLVNAIRGTYLDENNQWQPSDFPNVVLENRVEEDGQERIWGDLDLPLVASAATAQRLAKIAIERNHQHIRATLPCKLSALRLQAGDTVKVTNARLGWSAKVFEVESIKFIIDRDERGTPRPGIDVVVREHASTIWDWTPAADEKQVSSAPTTTLDPRIFTQILADVGGAMKNETQEWTQAQNFDAAELTDDATIDWNVGTQQVASVTLEGNRTLANPANMRDGGTYILIVKQDATGNRTLSYDTAYKWPGGSAPTLSTAANAIDVLYFVSDGTSMFGTQQLDFS